MTEKKQRIDPIRRVRGMQDFLPERAAGMRRIAGIAEDVARLYGFERIEIPILERASLYRRSLGLGSDVVMKEMYAFEDKKDKNDNSEELCLRPEGTAGVMRMLIENGLTQTLPQRWFYEGAMFRRERPQKGRFRQFHQCGIEMLATRYDFRTVDLEVLRCAWYFLKELGLENKVTLKFNWLGSVAERERYSEVLKQHFQKYANDDALSLESIGRLERGNALRILDSKDPSDQEAIENAPVFELNEKSKKNIEAIENWLTNNLKIPYKHDSRLVRGLDYYSDLVYEFVEKGSTREQSTVLAGGRYNALCEQIGGRVGEYPVMGVGWAAGLERLLDLSSSLGDFHSKTKTIKICLADTLDGKFAGRSQHSIMKRLYDFNDFRKKLFSIIVDDDINVVFPVIEKTDRVAPDTIPSRNISSEIEKFKIKMAEREKADFLIRRTINDENFEKDDFTLLNIKKKESSLALNEDEIIKELKEALEDFIKEEDS